MAVIVVVRLLVFFRLLCITQGRKSYHFHLLQTEEQRLTTSFHVLRRLLHESTERITHTAG